MSDNNKKQCASDGCFESLGTLHWHDMTSEERFVFTLLPYSTIPTHEDAREIIRCLDDFRAS